MRQRTSPRVASISYSGGSKVSRRSGSATSTTARPRSLYFTRISPSVTRVRKRQYVRARRSRCVGVQISSSASRSISTSARCTERTASVSGSIDV